MSARRDLLAFSLAIACVSSASAGPYEDAEAAIKAGNEDNAISALRPLAAKGETRAQYEVGQLLYLFKTQGGEAKRLLQSAAAKGHGEAMYYLANMTQLGKVIPHNKIEAYKWYVLAIKYASPQKPGYGDPRVTAEQNRDGIAKQMTPAEIAEGQRLANEWKPQQAQVRTAEPSKPPRNALIKYECLKTDNSGLRWLVDVDTNTKQVFFTTSFLNGPKNISGPHRATITADKITWEWNTVVGRYSSKTLRTIDRRTGKGTIEITYPDEPKWEERNIPCKPL
jgi:hypothetical protein